MNAKVIKVLLLSIFTIIILTSGCQENSTPNNKRARLVGNQNLGLRKQLAAEIEKRQAELAECEARVEKQIMANQQLGGNTIKILKDFADRDKNYDVLTDENLQLKEKIRQLELKLSNSQ